MERQLPDDVAALFSSDSQLQSPDYISPVSLVLAPEGMHKRFERGARDIASHGVLERLSSWGMYRLFFTGEEKRRLSDPFVNVCVPSGHKSPVGMTGPALVIGPLLKDSSVVYIEARRVETGQRTYIFT